MVLGARGVASLEVPLAVADLRDESLVGSKTRTQVLALDEPVDLGCVVRPAQQQGVILERAAVPFARQVRAIGSAAVAPQGLAGDRIGGARSPVEIRYKDRVVESAVDRTYIGETSA